MAIKSGWRHSPDARYKSFLTCSVEIPLAIHTAHAARDGSLESPGHGSHCDLLKFIVFFCRQSECVASIHGLICRQRANGNILY